jgi:tRNA-uridine 2-sulfurtransferase
VFNLSDDFERSVVEPYVAAHAAGRTPNPCIECNRRIKFDRLLARAERLGFEALATGHHARVVPGEGGVFRLLRGVDPTKDQSYVLSMLDQRSLARVVLPIGRLTKGEVRARAAALGLRTADKPDSQDVCFVSRAEGRQGFLVPRIELHQGELVDAGGSVVGRVPAVELVTVGQRRGMGHADDGTRRYAVALDVARRRVTVGTAQQAARREVRLLGGSVTWVADALDDGADALAQVSAHGRVLPCTVSLAGGVAEVRFVRPERPVAPGQTVAFYDVRMPEAVIGAAIAA